MESLRPSLVEGAIRTPRERKKETFETIHTSAIQVDDPIRVKNRESYDDYEEDLFLLYKLFEVALKNRLTDPLVLGTTDHIPQPTKEFSNPIWHDIQEWFSDHQQDEDRHAAATLEGDFSMVPLHLLCQQPNPPIGIVMTLVQSAPKTTAYVDENGWLPLHYACCCHCGDLLKVLLEEYPQGVLIQDNQMRTPLHFAFCTNASGHTTTTSTVEDNMKLLNTIEMLTNLRSETAEIADAKGRTPLHLAAAYGSSLASLESLVNTFPEAVNLKENLGRTPLHYVMANAHEMTSPTTLKFMLERSNENVIYGTDYEGNLPLHLLARRATKYNPLEDSPSRQNLEICLKIYLNAKPPSKYVPEFCAALQSLPQWLRTCDGVVTNTHVRDILNKNISKRFPTMILLLDCYNYFMIIICFQIASRAHVKFDFQNAESSPSYEGTIAACYLGATYFLIRETLQLISMISLGAFQSWFLNAMNWFDIIIIGFVFHYCGVMWRRKNELDDLGEEIMLNDFGKCEEDSDRDFRTGAALTLGTLWIAFIYFLKSTFLDFAVFVETIKYVTRYLFTFLVAVSMILILFAQSFFLIFRNTPICEESNNEDSRFLHCDFGNSLMTVFVMMVGEIGDDVYRYQDYPMAQVLFVAFTLLVVILLLNILIAMVTESHSLIKNERSEILFWSNRLCFVSEMGAVMSFNQRMGTEFNRFCFRNHSYDEAAVEEDHISDSQSNAIDDISVLSANERKKRQGLCREVWIELLSFVQGDSLEDPTLSEFLLSLFFRCLVCVVLIPIWLLAGVITAGWLWPPQVREWLFFSYSRSVRNTEIGLDVSRLKKNVVDLNNNTELELVRVRKEIHEVQTDIEKFKDSFQSDLTEIKEVISALLETCRIQAQVK